MEKLTLLISLTLLPLFSVFSQVETIKRIEFELKEGFASHDLAKFDDNGILFYSKSTDKKGKTRQWKIEQYSTDLELLDTKFIEIPSKQFLDETYSNTTDLYLFFSDKKATYSLFKINAKTLKIEKVIGSFPPKVNVNEIRVIDDYVYFDANIKRAPMLFSLNIKTGKQNLIPITLSGYNPKDLIIEDVQVMDNSKEVLVYINAYMKGSHDIFILRFNNEGEKKSTTNLTENQDMKLSSISASFIEKGVYLYTGTYSKRSSTSSQGVYLCKTVNDEVKFIKFYNFLEFDKFLSYLPEKKQAKNKCQKTKKKAQGKELEINYLMVSHDIMLINGTYLYVGEAYYPTYRTETYTSYVNGKPVTRTRTVFDGYQYTHATIVGFNQQGEKLWDNTFEMWPSYKPYFRKKFITSSIEDDRKLNLLFSSRSEIKAMTFFSNGEVSKEEVYSFIETGSEKDKVKYSYSNLEYWYGKYFLAHGRQLIKNKEEAIGNKKREVYFINKITYK